MSSFQIWCLLQVSKKLAGGNKGLKMWAPVCKKIVEYFKNNVPQRKIAKALQISSSTMSNIIKRFR